MFCKIKSFLAVMGLKPTDIGIRIKADAIGIEDEKTIEQRKRVSKAFESQHKEMQARALVAHESDCEDPVYCAKPHCFKWEPDRIVGEAQVVERRGRKKKIETGDSNVLDMGIEEIEKNVVDSETKEV